MKCIDLSKPKESKHWPVRAVVYDVGDMSYLWGNAFDDAIDSPVSIVGVTRPSNLPEIITKGDELVFRNCSALEIRDCAAYVYACVEYANRSEADELALRKVLQDEETKNVREFYAQFDQIPGPPA